MLDLRSVTKRYASAAGAVVALDSVSLRLPAATSLALTGESGSGKSTLLHLAAGLDAPDSGEIEVAGRRVDGASDSRRATLRRESIGLVFQQFNLIPSLDVSANVGFQARLAGRHDPEWQAELIRRLGLSGLEDRYPEALSGGQQQRVAVGRALAPRPPLILADEPTGALDEASGDAVLDLLLGLVRDTGAALLMVTHSDRIAARLGARAHLRAGRIVS